MSLANVLTVEGLNALVQAGRLEHRPCKRCGALIFVLKDAGGAYQPLDTVARVYRVALDVSGEPVAVPTVAFVSHFVMSCKEAP